LSQRAPPLCGSLLLQRGGSGPGEVGGGAEGGDLAGVAVGFAGGAAAAAVPDEPVAGHGPVGGGEELHEVLLDLLRCGGGGEAEAFAEAGNVGVDDEANIDAVAISKDDVGGLAADAVQGGEFVHGPRHVASVLVDEGAAAGLDVLRLVPIEADAADVGLELFEGRVGVVGGGPVLLEEVGGDHVDLPVGALRREDRGDEQFERIRVVQLAVGIGVGLAKDLRELGDAFGAACGGFTGHGWKDGGAGRRRLRSRPIP